MGTFENIALELSRALEPLAARFHDPHHAVMLLGELGLRIPPQFLTPTVQGAVASIHTAAHALPEDVEALVNASDSGNVGNVISTGVSVAKDLALLIDAFQTLADRMSTLGGVPNISPAELNAFLAALPKRLFETILIEYLESYHRLPFTLLEFLGLIERTHHNPGSTDPGQPEFVKKELRFDRIGQLLSSPDQLFVELYGWGQPSFKPDLLIERVGRFLEAVRIPITFLTLPGTPPRQAIEVCVATIARTPDGVVPVGIEAILAMTVADGVALDLPIADGWLAHLAAEGQLGARVGVRVQPPAVMTVIPPSGTAQGQLKVGVAAVPVAPAERMVLLGIAGGTGLTAERIELDLLGGFRWDSTSGKAEGDFGFGGEIRGGKLKISMDGADGFLASILSGVNVEADFNLGLGWTANQGLYFSGSSTLEIQLPAHISLGPIELDALTFSVGIDGNRFPIGLTTNIKAALGPLQGVVEELGAAIELSFPSSGRGDIGPLDLDFKFKPPKGVGLSLDVGIVRGGGYLFIDVDRGEYAGVLELSFSGIVTLTAIGLITTKMPDGSNGFSLLIIISVEFGNGIQLGFGFTLLAVGGLVGVNRTMDLQALAEGVRSGSLSSVMFPTNVIANAPRIISDLRTFFPPKQDTFLIGPMAKLGWGTPTLVSVSLGIIIEIPGNIAIVGLIRVVLPTEEAALVVLQVAFIGALEFDKKRLWFFASIFDSRIVFLTIEGEMGLLVAWGDDANFVLSVGGFHPSFTPPPLPFPSPRRIAVNILNTSVARIRIEGYFAVTSNTVQLGARAELYFGLDILNVQGHLAFDALFQFSPFYFIIEISASLSVNVFGAGLFSVHISGSLKGPARWNVKGHGSLTILFWDIGVDFEKTWGETSDTELPPVPVMPMLAAELDKSDNWLAILPKSNNLLVSLRKMTGAEAALILHPVGTLRVSQRGLPLQIKLDKVGTQKPSDVNSLSVAVTTGGLGKKGDTFERFAPAQYQNFSDADKLSKPAFVSERAGVELSASGADLRSSKLVKRVVRYEEIIIDNNFKRFQRRFRADVGALFNVFLRGAAVTRSELSKAHQSKLQPFEEKIAVAEETFTVAFQANNRAIAPEAIAFHSETSARDYLNRKVSEDPSLIDAIHVIPSFERAA
jgi:hypothetical protein